MKGSIRLVERGSNSSLIPHPLIRVSAVSRYHHTQLQPALSLTFTHEKKTLLRFRQLDRHE